MDHPNGKADAGEWAGPVCPPVSCPGSWVSDSRLRRWVGSQYALSQPPYRQQVLS
jgi:hypothetical protein